MDTNYTQITDFIYKPDYTEYSNTYYLPISRGKSTCHAREISLTLA